METNPMTIQAARLELENQRLRRSAAIVVRLLELGDERLLAREGPAGGQLPDLTPEEWGTVYRECKRIARRGGRDE